MAENDDNQSKRLSTPSFKSPEKDDENYNKSDKINYINELKKLNELLLKKIMEYESILKINQNNEDIKDDNIRTNPIVIQNNIKNNNEKENEVKYYQNKYIHCLKIIHEYKKKDEMYEISIENIKNDLLKSKSEIKELTKKLKENNINIENNYIDHVTSLSSIKLNNLYNPNEYIILCDKEYKKLKWFLMKKKSNEKEEEKNTYDNLIWVPKIDIVDLNNFNKYVNEEEENNTNEIINLVKKLEEKENLISKLTFKLEKLEKDFEINNTYNSIEQNLKSKNSNNRINYFKNTLNEDNILNTNGFVVSIRKDISRSQNNIESNIPIEKYNILLEKLNQMEENFVKLQKENIELRKYYKLYLEQNNNNPININNKNELINNNNKIESNKINNFSLNEEEDDYYKNKYNELEMKLKIMKEACKNILMRLSIPKKDKEEIKQILKLFEFSEEETLIIIGDKKK